MLRGLWEHGPSTVRQLVDRLYEQRKRSQAATVLKLLERLEAKGCVERNDEGPALEFAAIVDRDDLIERRLQTMADALCDGSREPLLMHLVDPQRLSKAEINTLRSLVDDLEKQQQQRKKRTKKRR